jgi:hypothetical protein
VFIFSFGDLEDISWALRQIRKLAANTVGGMIFWEGDSSHHYELVELTGVYIYYVEAHIKVGKPSPVSLMP